MSDNRPESEIYYEAGVTWADAQAAADLLEDLKSSFLSQRMQDWITQGMAVNKAEATVKASPEWQDYVRKMVSARKTANTARVYLDSVKMRAGERNSEEANHRLSMKI